MTEPLMVQVVFGSEDVELFPWHDVAQDGDDLARMSDKEVLARVAAYMDRPMSDFERMVVGRPTTGNILISEDPTLGEEYKTKRVCDHADQCDNQKCPHRKQHTPTWEGCARFLTWYCPVMKTKVFCGRLSNG